MVHLISRCVITSYDAACYKEANVTEKEKKSKTKDKYNMSHYRPATDSSVLIINVILYGGLQEHTRAHTHKHAHIYLRVI